MKLLIVVFALLAISGAVERILKDKQKSGTGGQTFATIESGTFATKVDHFRPQDTRFVNFTYHANFDNFESGGPVYIYINDKLEGTKWIESGLLVDIAQQTNGALFTFDLRYFGENIPTETSSFEDLQYLTAEQILADIAAFITAIQQLHNTHSSRLVLVGSGYGATLATYARKKYPHLIDGAWSSSGIFEINFYSTEIYDTLPFTIERAGGLECRATFTRLFQQIATQIRDDTADNLQDLFNLCHPINTTSRSDVAAFFEYRYLQIIEYINENHAAGIVDLCRNLHVLDDPVQAFARWLDFNFPTFGGCVDESYEGLVETQSNTSWNQPGTDSGKRQSLYLQCTQFGLFLITDNFSWFPNTLELDYHIQKCTDLFGPDYDLTTARLANDALRRDYGTFNQRTSNVIYVNGEIDPYYYTGMLFSDNPNSIVYLVFAHSKSSDLIAASTLDPAQLGQVKASIVQRITDIVRH